MVVFVDGVWVMKEGIKKRAIRDFRVCEDHKKGMPMKKLGEITKMIFKKIISTP